MSVKPKKEAQMELLKKYLQEEKYGSLEVVVKRKKEEGKEERNSGHCEKQYGSFSKNRKTELICVPACSVMSDALQSQRL